MQTWDKRQSRNAATGSGILILVVAAVLINRSWTLLWMLPALAAGAAFYAVNMRRYLRRRRLASEPFPPNGSCLLPDTSGITAIFRIPSGGASNKTSPSF